MKNRWKHIFIPVLTMALCLSLAACGNSDNVAGDDWRTTGMAVGSGTITHDGESVDVLVTVSESSAAFYRDLPEQVLFDSVSFPMNIPDAEQAFNAISFDDMDDDGESDVLVSFIHENGDATELIWIWDPVERYVFREDLSTVAISGGDLSGDDLSEYVGLWEYQGENLWLRIRDDATWEFVNDQDEVIEYGALGGRIWHHAPLRRQRRYLAVGPYRQRRPHRQRERRYAPACGGHPVSGAVLHKKRH